MEFIDLSAQNIRLRQDIERRLRLVMEHSRYILGPEVEEFEAKLAAFGGAQHAVSCANGTDAILLPLLAWGIREGDAVICPSFTYCATAEAIVLAGATPIFADVQRETYTLDPESVRAAVQMVLNSGRLVPKAILAVDLFGQSADYPTLSDICDEFDLKLISDCAQGFGTTWHGQPPVTWADAVTTSFFPAKPLGCYGDGGAVMTNHPELAARLRILRMHGHGSGENQYDVGVVGINSRLDSFQAAVLLAKLEVFPTELITRDRIADRYSTALADHVRSVPTVPAHVRSTWAQYTVEVDRPDALAKALAEKSIPTARYYPRPIHTMSAYDHHPKSSKGLTNTKAAATRTISLPMHAYLTQDDQDRVIDAVKACGV